LGPACGMYRGRGGVHAGFWWKKPERKSYQEDLDVDRIILNWMLNLHDGKRKETTRKILV